MRFIKTTHYRLISFVVALFLIASAINHSRHESALLPEYRGQLISVAGLIALLTLIFVRPTNDSGPLKVPNLSVVKLRIVCGVLLVLAMLCLANYYLLDPGLFAPYKKQALVASLMLMGLFIVLYHPALAAMGAKGSSRNDRDA